MSERVRALVNAGLRVQAALTIEQRVVDETPARLSRRDMDSRKRERGTLDYEDMLVWLTDALDGVRGKSLAAYVARTLPVHADRRVPGYRQASVENLSSRVCRRRRRQHCLRDRRSQAGNLRIPRCRRIRLPASARATRENRGNDGSVARKFPIDRRHDRRVQPDFRSKCRGSVVHRQNQIRSSGQMRAACSASYRDERQADRAHNAHEVSAS